MDDSLERPNPLQKPVPTLEQQGENDEGSTDGEDEGPDWTKLPYVFQLRQCNMKSWAHILYSQ